MKRFRGTRAEYITPFVFQETLIDGAEAASAVGVNKRGTNHARIVKAFDRWTLGNADYPDTAPPATELTSPSDWDTANAASGWRAWWPNPPSVAGPAYTIPDPPLIDRPILPTRENPILWSAAGIVGEAGRASWTRTISAIYARCQFSPQTGHEKISTDQDLAIVYGTLKVRPQLIENGGVVAKEWQAVLLRDMSVWDIESVQPSFRPGEFYEIIIRGVT